MHTLFTCDPMDQATKKMKFLPISFQHENLLLILESIKKSAYVLLQDKHDIIILQFIIGNVACIGNILPAVNFC